MALSDFTSNLTAAINFLAKHSNGDGFTEAQYPENYSKTQSFTFGTASWQANQVYAATRSVDIAANDDIDLSGVLTNWAGETILFTAIKKILIFNRSTRDGNNLIFGGGPLNTILSDFGASSALANTAYAEGVWERSMPHTGYTVSGGSADVFRVHNNGTTAIDYDILIIGVG